MKKYFVTLPISGQITVEVEAESEEAAIQAAFESPDIKSENLEWETHRQICRGNVFGGQLNEAYVEEIE